MAQRTQCQAKEETFSILAWILQEDDILDAGGGRDINVLPKMWTQHTTVQIWQEMYIDGWIVSKAFLTGGNIGIIA